MIFCKHSFRLAVCFLSLVLLVGCSSAPAKPPKKDPIETPIETGEFTRTEGLTNTFSYRRLVWGSSPTDVVERLGEPNKVLQSDGFQMMLFETKTRGFPTTVSAVLHSDHGLSTIDLVIIDPTKCPEAIVAWKKALQIKYGTPAGDETGFTVWKLADGSRIVIEKNALCSIVYAKDAATRNAVNKAF